MKKIHFAMQFLLGIFALVLIVLSLVNAEFAPYWLFWFLLTGFIQAIGSITWNVFYRFRHKGFRYHFLATVFYFAVCLMVLNIGSVWRDERTLITVSFMIPPILLSIYYTRISYALAYPVRKGWLDL